MVMPLKRCTIDGKSGWKWGDKGHCYTGPGAKKKAIKQGVAVEGPEGFKKEMGKANRSAELLEEINEQFKQGKGQADGN
jgi:hypothetical protein